MYGAGSAQAQHIQIARGMELDVKKKLAQRLAGISAEPAAEAGKVRVAGPDRRHS
ncbi:hypothetical protein ACQR1I_09905 [Bradyrhizobium sp. HKCCYLS2038]|uniref:hypothetical protein n=1 Tax=unclassified Bradyrhizobium TaxID=2631580 RepID=UPI003EBE08F7